METPVCSECAKASVLCPACEEKISSGRVSTLDVEVARALGKIGEGTDLSGASFAKALDIGKVLLILTRGDINALIGKEGAVVNALSQALGRKIRIAEISGDRRKMVGDLIAPAALLGINVIFKQGADEYRIRVAKQDAQKMPLDRESMEKALEALLEAKTLLVLE